MTLKHQFYIFFRYLVAASLLGVIGTESDGLFTPNDISDIVDNSCFVGFNTLSRDPISAISEQLKSIFHDDSSVTIGMIDLASFIWKPGRPLQFANSKREEFGKDLVIFPRRKLDRTCLMTGFGKPYPVAEIFTGVISLQNVVDFINIMCNTYKSAQGGLSIEGLHRQEILRTLYHVNEHTNISSNKFLSMHSHLSSDHDHVCSSEFCGKNNQNKPLTTESNKDNQKYTGSSVKMHECEKISVPSKNKFFHNYLKISKPVIITGAMDNWQAFSKWTNEFFRKNYGDRNVHIKLTPDGEFEGVEPANLFENFNDFRIPEAVYKQLLYPDLVVVRPAVANMKLMQFIDIIEQVSNGSRKGFSAYLEYSSIADILPELQEDIAQMPFFDNMLKLEHTNIWLSDGNTLGKLHFDPFDNFLCQVSF